jgi:hypothetical protein
MAEYLNSTLGVKRVHNLLIMVDENTDELLDRLEKRERLYHLQQEHRDLDAAIQLMVEDPAADQLRMKRLKMRKLNLKDTISHLHSELIPDMDA